MKIGIIGAGAAGFFSALSVKEHHPDYDVIILEKSHHLLSKVKISGGGKCNVTNDCRSIAELCEAYPRGGKNLRNAFKIFNTGDTIHWFESRGVPLMIREDHCVFPASLKSQSIIDCLMDEAKRLDIHIETGMGVKTIRLIENKIELQFEKDNAPSLIFDKVIIATGGSPKRSGLEWLEVLDHKIEDPVPSLFTFNIPGDPICKLTGVSVEQALVTIQGTKLQASGPLLITHWGMSGPAILKLSAFGARKLSELNYHFIIRVNWANTKSYEKVMKDFEEYVQQHSKKHLSNFRPYDLPGRLWSHLLEKVDLSPEKIWGDLGKKSLNKLANTITNDEYSVKGKTTFKEEFVTCGGVSLESIDMDSMRSKVCRNIYFAGEVVDVDAITGGFNFQAAWTTGFIAGKLG